MSNLIHLADKRLAHQLRASLPYTARSRQTGVPIRILHRDRGERRRAEQREQIAEAEALRAKQELTAADLCWKCMQPLDATKFLAWSGDLLIVTHAGCR